MNIREPKERGEWAEFQFMARAAEHGLKPIKPWGQTALYDLVIDLGGRFVSIQVKSTCCQARPRKPHHRQGVFRANLRRTRSQSYLPSDFDYLALYVIPKDVWYIVPAAVATRRRFIRVCPGNRACKYERYREAWHLLRH